jgi:opacity protein-like surface antigen
MTIKMTCATAVAALLLAAPAYADGGPIPEPEPVPEPEPMPEPMPEPEPAPAPEEGGFYVEGFGGITLHPDLEWEGEDFEMDMGFAYGGAIGMNVSPDVDLEVEVTYAEAEYSCCNPNEVNALGLFGNGFYNFHVGDSADIYAGAGLGAVRVEYDSPFIGGGADGWGFGYQLIGGFKFPLFHDNLEAFAEYRWQDVPTNVDTTLDGGEGFNVEFNGHFITGGLRFTFR